MGSTGKLTHHVVCTRLVRVLITRMIEDVIAESGRRVTMLKPQSVSEVREAPSPLLVSQLQWKKQIAK